MTEFRDHFAHSQEQKEPDKAMFWLIQTACTACFPCTPPCSSLSYTKWKDRAWEHRTGGSTEQEGAQNRRQADNHRMWLISEQGAAFKIENTSHLFHKE